jgi:integrase
MATRKRGQNEGSIYQRKQDGYWIAAVSLGNGKRKVLYGRTAEEARDKRSKFERDLEQSTAIRDGKSTVGQVFEAWLTSKQGTIRPKTYERYASLIKRHGSEIGSIRLSKLDVADLEHLYRSREQIVSPKTVRHLHFVIKASLAWAVRRGMLSRSPAELITPEELPRITRQRMRVLSIEESQALMGAARGTKAEGLITFALVTGARIGEVMGLTWDRVDLQSGRVRITHSLQYLAGTPTLVEPKTNAAVREIVLPEFALKVILAHRTAQHERALRLGPAWSNKLNLVFVRETGEPLNRHAVLRQYLRPLLKTAKLPPTVRVHDLRHGAASLMLSQGIPVPVVAELLGHATPAITMSIYSHALPNSQQLIAKQMEAVFGGD